VQPEPENQANHKADEESKLELAWIEEDVFHGMFLRDG
jgi:hypothetical protein